MADVNLASLNFKLHIDDDGFSDDIKKYIDMAQQMNTQVSGLLEGLGKVTSGRGVSAKKGEILLGLREEIKQAERDLDALTQAHNRMWKNLQRNSLGEIAYPNAEKTFKEQGERVDALRAKLANLRESYQKLGGDKALAASFKETKKAASDTNIELLQMREYYKQMASGATTSASAQRKMTEEARRGNRELSGMSRMWRDIKNYTMMYFSFEGARRLVSNLVNISAEFEKQRISLRAILQDADGADRIFEQMKSLAVQSPFQFKELASYAKQLSAYSIPMNELYDTTKMLADVSAGLGVGMDRLVLAYGQIRSASFLRGQEVRQLTEAGIPILTELAKQFEELEGRAVSAGEVFDKISKRQVTFEMVEKVFKDMTSEGGKFYQMQEVLADTLSGRISNLTDAYQIMFAEIGEKNSGVLYGTVDALRRMAENYEEVGRALARLVAIYGTYKVALTSITIWHDAQALAGTKSIRAFTSLGKAIRDAATETKAFQTVNSALSKVDPYAALAAGAATLVMWIVKMSKYTSDFERAQKSVNDTVADYNAKADAEGTMLKYLIDQMRGLNKESDEYQKIRKQIISQYGQYMDEVDRENLALKNLTAVYDKLSLAIKKSGYEKMMAAGREKIADYYKDTVDGIWNELNQALTRAGIDTNGKIAAELRGKVIGTVGELSEEAADAARKIYSQTANRNLLGNIWHGILNLTTPYSLFEHDDWRKHNIDDLVDMYKDANDRLVTMTKELEGEGSWFEAAMGGDKEEEKLKGWKAELSGMVDEASKAGVKLGITVDAMSDFVEMSDDIDKAVDKSASALARYRKAGEKDLAAEEETRLKYLQRMQARLGGPGKGATKSAITAQNKAELAPIQEQIRVYQKLKDVYESLVATLGDEGARNIMASFFPQYGDMVKSDFDAKIQRLSDDMLELALTNEDAAKAWLTLQDALSEDKSKALIKSAEAAEKYREEIQKWIDEGYDLQGSGFSFDLSKIFRGLTTQNAGTDRTFEALKRNVEASEAFQKSQWKGTEEEKEKMWQDYKAEAFKVIDDIAAHEKENNRKVAEEKVNDLASKYVKDMYRTNEDGAIELTDWGDKSLEQIQRISEALRHLMTQDLQLPKSIIDEANRLGISLEDLKQAIQDMFSADYKNTVEEKIKRIGSIATNVSNLVSKMAGSLSSLGENIEDDAVKSLGEMLDVVNQITAAVLECEPLMRYLTSDIEDALDNWDALLKSGDLLTMVVKILGIGMEQIVKHVSAQYEKQKAITEAAREYKRTLDEIALSRYEGVLGVDDMGKLSEYYRQMSKATAEWARTVDSMDSYAGLTDYLLSTIGALGKDMRDLDLTQLKELQALMKRLNAEGYVGDGMLDELDDYIQKIESYEEAISDIFSRVADDIVDNLISAFDEVGDSVADIEDAFYDLGDVILRSVLRSMVLEGIVERYKDDFMKAVTEYALSDKTENDATALAAQLGNITSNLRQELEDSGSIFNAIIEAFRDAGLVDYNMSSEASNTLGGGIKSITEDTANLLASYVNAIRADVAAIRQAVVAGNTNTLPTPTLAEYLTQIQANTYNNAVATQAILENLQSMMTVSDGPALRVFM